MENYFGAYVDIYGAIITLILFLIIVVRKDFYAFHEKVLVITIFLTFTTLLIEATTFFIDGHTGYRALNYFLNFIMFLGTAIIAGLWAIYVDYKMYHSIQRLKRRLFYSIPVIVMIILLIINLFEPVVFKIDTDNYFQRGDYLIIPVILLYSMFLYLLVNLVINFKNMGRRAFGGLFALLIFPAIGGTLQTMYYGFSSLYSMFALGLMTAYISLENIAVNTDTLTNLFTRSKVMSYLQSLHTITTDYRVVLFDMDNLKELNDALGHHVGDEALIVLSTAIRSAFAKDSMVARIGGDEILVVTENCDEDFIEKAIQDIKRDTSNIPDYEIKFSYGSMCSFETKYHNIDRLLRDVDERMYEQKAIHKNYKRRKTD